MVTMRDRRRGLTVPFMSQTPGTDPSTSTNVIENPSKPTEEWVTGDEPMTGPQHSYLQTLAREAGREVPESLTKAQASELIEELQGTTGRGQS
jgi:Protein of unknown function (DUF3072)